MIMVKRLKLFGICCLIMGACWIVPLVTSINVAESNKWKTIQVPGNPAIKGNTIRMHTGIYEKAMEYCWMCGCVIFVFVTIGAEFLIVAVRIDKLPINKKYGKIKEKNKKKVIVEFIDGTRAELITEPKLIVMPGDFGMIDFKSVGSKRFGEGKEYMISFEKMEENILDNPNKSFGV